MKQEDLKSALAQIAKAKDALIDLAIFHREFTTQSEINAYLDTFARLVKLEMRLDIKSCEEDWMTPENEVKR